MSMKHVKALVDEFSTREFEADGMKFAEVLRKGKVLVTLAQGSDLYKLYSWPGKAHNRQGKLKERDRSTRTTSLCTQDLQVELDRTLHKVVGRVLVQDADGLF